MNNELIKDVFDEERGCGFREEGGLYLRAEGFQISRCGRLPVPVAECECCGLALRQSRGFTWFNPQRFIKAMLNQEFDDSVCLIQLLKDETKISGCSSELCNSCPFGIDTPMRAGLIWIGAEYYPQPQDFIREAATLGISRKIPALPKGFVVGETIVYCAHPHGWNQDEPAVFTAFKPNSIEYVTTGEENEEDLQLLIDKGITPVKVFNDKNSDWNDEGDDE